MAKRESPHLPEGQNIIAEKQMPSNPGDPYIAMQGAVAMKLPMNRKGKLLKAQKKYYKRKSGAGRSTASTPGFGTGWYTLSRWERENARGLNKVRVLFYCWMSHGRPVNISGMRDIISQCSSN